MWIVEFKYGNSKWYPCKITDYTVPVTTIAAFSSREEAREYKKLRSIKAESLKYRERKIG